MNPRVRLRIRVLFSLVTLSLLGGIFLIFNTVRAEQRQRGEAARTAEVIAVLHDLSRDVVNAETGQRGFMITLDPRYLAPYDSGRNDYRRQVARLQALSKKHGNQRKIQLGHEISELVEAKFEELARSIAMIRDARLLDARREVLTDEGQGYMERLRAALTEYEVLETQDLSRYDARVAQAEALIFPLLLGLLALIVVTLGMGLLLAVRAADAEARASQANALSEARDRADLLARELNHRVKNLFAVVLALVTMSGRDSPESKPVLERVAARIRALLNAHQVTQGETGKEHAQLAELIETVIAPYRSGDTECVVEGPVALLNSQQIVPVGLILHEMVTNAVKYGAWAQPGGKLAITWALSDAVPPHLTLDWCETCSWKLATGDGKQGFGTMLLKSSSRQLGATFTRELDATGMALHLDIPLAS